MKPRFDFIKTRSIRPEEEAFGLDIAVYKDAHKAETYLKEDVHEFYKYPFKFLLFFPRDKVIKKNYVEKSLIIISVFIYCSDIPAALVWICFSGTRKTTKTFIFG